MQKHAGWSREQWEAMKALPPSTPLHMINLIRLREWADYPADHPKHTKAMSGWDAYRDYGVESEPIFRRMGGRQIWLGKPELVLIGPENERWDLAFIAEYPSFDAFREMWRDPDYQRAVLNRAAAVLDSRLIRCLPGKPGGGFGLAQPEQGQTGGHAMKPALSPQSKRLPPPGRWGQAVSAFAAS